ncbi:MAG: aminomethyl transferase family protein [Acidimicrobiaceae bacterium]|nr:aminomethyl transferase family protein [Acidimicrobiaceae bacterium]MBT5581963.1 aminomethyl transferase family protein [Acidimicrobiaceae bacterium]MBT5849509.1 aminomethyl transferase family protein [Acidimicrobiaceae bacterium]
MSRHPYHDYEAPLGPRYTVYNRRHMACCFDATSTMDGYWKLRQSSGVLHTGEFPLEFVGPDAEKLLNQLFTKDITKIRPGRCGYGIACYHDGGMIVDGVLLRLDTDRFWYAQADGDFYSWARSHANGMDVRIFDPHVYVSQVQGPDSLRVLEAASDNGMPDPFNYFGIATVSIGGQSVVITRTGYTNELGWEFYTEPSHNADEIWAAISAAGKPFGQEMIGLDAMHIRRIEAGILNAGSDFNHTTTPFDVGLGRFVDLEKSNFIGKRALDDAPKHSRLTGLLTDMEPLIGGSLIAHGQQIGRVTAGAMSPFLRRGIGIALLETAGTPEGTPVFVDCVDGSRAPGVLAGLPLYDKDAAIPRGKLVDIP